MLDLRLMRVTRRVPIDALARISIPLAKTGFAIAVATGVTMLRTNATEYVGNPFLLIKVSGDSRRCGERRHHQPAAGVARERCARADAGQEPPAGGHGRHVAGELADRRRGRTDDRLPVRPQAPGLAQASAGVHVRGPAVIGVRWRMSQWSVTPVRPHRPEA